MRTESGGRRAPYSSVILIVVLGNIGCGRKPAQDVPVKNEPTKEKEPAMQFTDEEQRVLRKVEIAVFRNKLIMKAQPPVTQAQITKIENKLEGKAPPDLVALWQTSFGGELDYDYEVWFGDHLYTASLRELFYPGSERYHDLFGWIDHELELAQEKAEEEGKPIPKRTPYLPFAGFEYLERFYVSLRPDEYGSVVVYAQGIPWKGRLNKDSVATVAQTVSELFDQLALNEDPFDDKSGEYAAGKDMAAKIRELEAEHPQLAGKLKSLAQRSIVDWEGILARTDFSKPLTGEQSRALRLALLRAVNRKDVNLIDRLHEKRAPFTTTLGGKGGVLCHAMQVGAFTVVERLLDLNVELGESPVIHASDCPHELLLRLLEHPVKFDEEAIYSAAETGAIDAAIALAKSSKVVNPKPVAQMAATALARAASHEDSAIKMENGQLGSYLTPKQYRERARALRDFAAKMKK